MYFASHLKYNTFLGSNLMAFRKQAVLFLASFNYFVTDHFKVYFYLLVYFLAYPFQNMELFPFSLFFFSWFLMSIFLIVLHKRISQSYSKIPELAGKIHVPFGICGSYNL